MIKLKVFISSVQKELHAERSSIGSFLATDDFLRECTAPRLFENYPQPLRPNPKAYFDLLRQCQVYVLIIGTEYGTDAGCGLSATHEEYRLAQELALPTLVCVKGVDKDREAEEATFFGEVKKDKHTYSRFDTTEKLVEVVGMRLREHIKTTYDVVPRKAQVEQSRLTARSASDVEKEEIANLSWDDLDADVGRDMIAAAEEQDKERIELSELPRLLLSRGYLWKDLAADVLRPTMAGALLLARKPGAVLSQSRIQMDAYAGTGRIDEPIDSVFVDAPLPRAIEQAVAFIRRNSARPLAVKGMKRKATGTYPAEALREVIVNAVAHRDYSDSGVKISVEIFADRLRVSSPGLPPGGQSLTRLRSGTARSRARNPLVVQGLSWLELMDERGSGIRRMMRVLEQNGSPAPSFKTDDDCLVVEFTAPVKTTDASPPPEETAIEAEPVADELSTREAILQEVSESGAITTARCVQRLGIPRTTASRTLGVLYKEGALKKSGSGRGTKYFLAKPSGA